MGYQVISGLLVFLCVQTAVRSYNPLVRLKDDKCETLTYDICRQMDYNRTIFPNYLGHRKQSEAITSVASLRPLLSQGCSPDVLTFLCSVYFPMCTSINELVPPCRELCLDVQRGCSGVLKKNGYVWPEALKCEQYPLIKTKVCIFQNRTGAKPTLPASFVLPTSRKRKVQPSSRKTMQKYCPADKVQKKQWKSVSQKDCCKCCQRGNRAARGGIARCTLRKKFSKEKSFLKTLKECTSRRSKRCYLDCCNAKRKEIQNKSKPKPSRNRNRRNRNKNRRKRPVG